MKFEPKIKRVLLSEYIRSPFKEVLAFLFLFLAHPICTLSQSTDETLIYIGLDTLSIDEAIKKHREGQSVKFDYPINITFDSAHFELVVNNQILAIVPNYLRKTITERYVRKTGFVVDNLPNGKVLLRVIKYVDVPPK